MSKKSALDLACKKLEELSNPECALFQSKMYADEWKQYFQKQADIPDGWEAIKEEIKAIDMYTKEKEIESPTSVAIARNRKRYLKIICKSNGIEVD